MGLSIWLHDFFYTDQRDEVKQAEDQRFYFFFLSFEVFLNLKSRRFMQKVQNADDNCSSMSNGNSIKQKRTKVAFGMEYIHLCID